MNLQGYRDTSYEYSGRASDLNRQLGFAAIAIIWLFKKDVAGSPMVPAPLIIPGMLVVFSLGLDLVHAVVGWFTWHCFYRSKEKANVAENFDIEHSDWLLYPIIACFVAKILCVVVAYGFILCYLFKTFVNPYE